MNSDPDPDPNKTKHTKTSSPASKQNRGRFKKGQSGNRKGRPKGTRSVDTTSSQILLDKKVVVTRDGCAEEISAEEALQHQTFKDALKGKGMAIRQVLAWIRARETWYTRNAPPVTQEFESQITYEPDNADPALMILDIAAFNPNGYGKTRIQLLLEPWAVQKALRRKACSDLDKRDHDNIKRCTRDAGSLIWPGRPQ